MALSLGKSFRRLLAQALAADEGEIRALVERVLPRGECGKRALRLENKDDRRLVPLAIVAALSADAITGDEADELKRQARLKATEARRPWWEDSPPGLVLLSPEERRRAGYVRPPEASFPPWRGRDAAKSGSATVNNNQNTMAAGDGLPQLMAEEKPNPL